MAEKIENKVLSKESGEGKLSPSFEDLVTQTRLDPESIRRYPVTISQEQFEGIKKLLGGMRGEISFRGKPRKLEIARIDNGELMAELEQKKISYGDFTSKIGINSQELRDMWTVKITKEQYEKAQELLGDNYGKVTERVEHVLPNGTKLPAEDVPFDVEVYRVNDGSHSVHVTWGYSVGTSPD